MECLEGALGWVGEPGNEYAFAMKGSTERLDLAKRAAKIGHKYDRPSGIDALEKVLDECLDSGDPDDIDLSAVNIIMELYLLQGR